LNFQLNNPSFPGGAKAHHGFVTMASEVGKFSSPFLG
jgi:hypothetical protein